MLLHYSLDILDDDNRVVDDDADRQHDRQQRNRVGGVADRVQHNKGADQAHRHRQGRDQRRAQAAEEQVDHEHDKDKRFDQRLLHLVNGLGDKGGRVIGHPPSHVVGEALLQFVETVADRFEGGNRIRPGCLIDGNRS